MVRIYVTRWLPFAPSRFAVAVQIRKKGSSTVAAFCCVRFRFVIASSVDPHHHAGFVSGSHGPKKNRPSVALHLCTAHLPRAFWRNARAQCDVLFVAHTRLLERVFFFYFIFVRKGLPFCVIFMRQVSGGSQKKNSIPMR